MSLVLTVAITAVTIVPPASADMTRPTWTVGDFWEYHVQQTPSVVNVDGRNRFAVDGTETIQVGGVNYPSWRLRTVMNLTITGFFNVWVNMSGFSWYRVPDLALVKQDLTGTYESFGMLFPVTTTVEWNPPQDIHWPLMTGDAWITSGWMNVTSTFAGMPSWANSTVMTNFRVEGAQAVSVPAGTFSTTPLNGTDSSGSFNVTYWAPDAGNYVWLRMFDSNGTQFQTWELTSYRYQLMTDTQPPSITGVTVTPPSPVAGVDSVTITATVTDDGQVSTVWVNVSQPNGTPVNRSMTAGAGNRWSDTAVWNQVGVHTFVIWASDATGKWASAAGSFTTIAPDTERPQISHAPPTGPFYPDTSFRIEATVTDNDAVQEVRIDYTDVAGTRHNVTMTLLSGKYQFTIPAQNATGTVRYTIWAIDPAGNANMTQQFALTVEARPQGLDVALVGGISVVILVVLGIAIALLVSRRRKRTGPPTSPPPASPPTPPPP